MVGTKQQPRERAALWIGHGYMPSIQRCKMMQTLEKYIPLLHVLLLFSIFKNNSTVQQLQEIWKNQLWKLKKISAADLLRAAVELRQVTIFQKEIWPPAALSREGGIHVKSCFLWNYNWYYQTRLGKIRIHFKWCSVLNWTVHGFILFS